MYTCAETEVCVQGCVYGGRGVLPENDLKSLEVVWSWTNFLSVLQQLEIISRYEQMSTAARANYLS